MKTVILIFIIFISPTLAPAQDSTIVQIERRLNNINMHVHFMGNMPQLSINYERLFKVHTHLFIAGNMGIGRNLLILYPYPSRWYTTIPIHVTGNYGKKRAMGEIGFGITSFDGFKFQEYVTYALMGLRLQPWNSNKTNSKMSGILYGNLNRTNYRIFLVLPLNIKSDKIKLGFSIGYCF